MHSRAATWATGNEIKGEASTTQSSTTQLQPERPPGALQMLSKPQQRLQQSPVSLSPQPRITSQFVKNFLLQYFEIHLPGGWRGGFSLPNFNYLAEPTEQTEVSNLYSR